MTLFLISGLIAVGQERKSEKRFQNIEPTKMAQMQTKQLTLALVLDQEQQNAIYDLQLEAVTQKKEQWESIHEARENNTLRDPKARFENKLDRLDAQIAYQEKMQEILNEDQFKQWRKIQARKKHTWNQKRNSRRKSHRK